VVSCAVRAAMSGRRQTRPPAILGEIDNCECNACVWRRAHEATLPAGKQTAPIRRRPTPVGPRRMRRFLRFCSCIPDPTLIQRIRYRLDGWRRRVASAYVGFTLDHQHLVCNSTLVTAAVGVCLLLLWVLGYTIPRPIPAAFSVAAILSAWSFRTLLLALRPAPQVLATIKMEQIANALPQIKEVWGMALKQQLDDYIDKALDHHQLNNGLDEEYYISALLYRAGPKSVIGHVLTTVSRRHEMNGITPLEYFISKAEAARVQWERTYGAKAESAGARQMRAMIDELDVRFDPTPAQEQALAYFRGILANKDREVHANVILAEEAIASIQAEIDEPAKKYYASNTVQKMVYLIAVREGKMEKIGLKP
jgi:hypothetical protein